MRRRASRPATPAAGLSSGFVGAGWPRHPWSEGRTGGARDIGENSRVLWLLSAASRVIRVTEAGQKYFFWGQWEATGEDGCVFSFAAAVSRASCRPSGRARPDTFFRGVDELRTTNASGEFPRALAAGGSEICIQVLNCVSLSCAEELPPGLSQQSRRSVTGEVPRCRELPARAEHSGIF